MRNNINIKGGKQTFKYLIEYNKNMSDLNGHNTTEGEDIICCIDNDSIKLFKDDIHYYRQQNEWYHVSNLPSPISNISVDSLIPTYVKTTNVKVYIPVYSISTYVSKIKYAVTAHTWINGVKIDFGTYIFDPTDAYAIPSGTIKDGNNEYYECVDFNIIDPYYLMYSDDWDSFRKTICKEQEKTNNTGSTLNISLYIVEEVDGIYTCYNKISGGYTNFVISNNSDYLELKLNISQNIDNTFRPGFVFDIVMNENYDSFIEYLKETYTLNCNSNDIIFEIVLKNKNKIITDSSIRRPFTDSKQSTFGLYRQTLAWDNISNVNLIKTFFKTSNNISAWENFEEGWSFVGSVTIYEYITEPNGTITNYELLSFVSNELPVTQEVFSILVDDSSNKIIDITDMNIQTFNVVNKIENKITHIERPNDSKANIMQPIFFKAKDTETLTLHPMVTENISINLDDYKSKVEKFTLQVGECQFNQIGANSYGILFKIPANILPKTVVSGTYYILDENKELVTTGKYTTVL